MGDRADFRLGAVTFHPATDEISGPAGRTHLEPKVMDFAVHMAARAGEVVGRDELIDEIWQGYPGASQSLTNAASKLRQALEDTGGDREVLETVPKRGYTLTALVEPVESRHRRTVVMLTAGLALALLVAILVADWAFESTSPVEQSVAVLPFENMSADPDQEYFAAGLTEELLNLLARVEGLKVTARTSSFLFEDADADVAEIGRALGVANLVEGSVRKNGNRVRITVQLIDADDGYHRWSKTFERELVDIFEIQDQIAGAVVAALKAEVMGVPEQRPDSRTTGSTEAYDLYLAGKQLLHQRGRWHPLDQRGREDLEAYRRMIELFERAVEIDPGFAPAWAGIANAYSRKPEWWLENYIERETVGARALEAARRAVELDPDLPEAHAALGLALGKFADKPEQGRVHLQKAIELNPGYATAHRWLAHHYRNAGHLSDALPLMERAAALDPLNNTTVGWYARTLAAMGRYDEATAELRRLHEDTPEAAIFQATPFTLAFESGRFVEAHYLQRSGRTGSWESAASDERTGCCSDQDLFGQIRVDVTLARFDVARSWLAELRESAPEFNLLRIAGHFWLLNATGQYKRLQMDSKSLLDLDLPRSLRNRALNTHGRASLLAGDVDSAIRSLESTRHWTNWRSRTTTQGLLAYAYMQADRPEAAYDFASRTLALLKETESYGNRRPVVFFRQAAMLALLDREEEAFEALEEAFEWGWRHYHQPDTFRPLLDQLIGDDPRYTAFTQRVLAGLEAMRAAVEAERGMTHEP
ncbi:MAG: winged helix-turn-helix domain-containing tetratricopeptide repeat protein [Candidatus Wenzhouxiangella sp. M2_3B_020]